MYLVSVAATPSCRFMNVFYWGRFVENLEFVLCLLEMVNVICCYACLQINTNVHVSIFGILRGHDNEHALLGQIS